MGLDGLLGGRQTVRLRVRGEAQRERALCRTPSSLAQMRPERILKLRAEHPDAILPGYYSVGHTWISIDLDANLPEDLVLDLCDTSYKLVFAKLPNGTRQGISATND